MSVHTYLAMEWIDDHLVGHDGFHESFGYLDQFGYYDEDDESYEPDITFYRPDGTTEGKSISWCKTNGFFEIQEGLWSGEWYYTDFPDAKAKQREKRKEDLTRTIKTSAGLSWKQVREIRSEIQKIDEIDKPYACLVHGCERRFDAEVDMKFHILDSEGKGHSRYARENGIALNDDELQEQEEKKRVWQSFYSPPTQEEIAEKLRADKRTELLDELVELIGVNAPEFWGWRIRQIKMELGIDESAKP